MKSHLRKPVPAGFTIIELLVVITIIALLFALTIGGFTYAQRSAARSRTTVTLNAIKSALERYNNEFGEYPAPQNAGDAIAIGDKSYSVGGAAMLYQALSGDGFDNILIAQAPSNAGPPQSNGSTEEEESKNIMLTDMPKEMWIKRDDRYFMADGFGRPFQYEKAVPVALGEDQVTINSTYDIWSYGEDEENTTARSIDTQAGGPVKDASQKWIKNW
ncbi:prepilin-type N-terminal cleavage/methylation domain-containing protein [Prosthecobacter fusiformis]|uniref:Prepilin-type N-terminal cleavage/methylation domain-containing protein n=1 Tax=Prosthecobacter fusiformis TaxID=48464 RepID=A0A4R7SQ56_9BACT|nr:type II secretion system protein [Prosthecobacter fusiformis]TDU81362.1 prepilin-type N-terminal cleavage/methylation domain-containing protein [Prosthecobacter fusiformis]